MRVDSRLLEVVDDQARLRACPLPGSPEMGNLFYNETISQSRELIAAASPSAAQLAEELTLVHKVVAQKDRQIRRLELDIKRLKLDIEEREFDYEDHDAKLQVQIAALESKVNRLENDDQMSKKDTELIELKTAYCELERRHNDLIKQQENKDSQKPDTSIEEQEYDQSQTLQPTSQAMSDSIKALNAADYDLAYSFQAVRDSWGDPQQKACKLAELDVQLEQARELMEFLMSEENETENSEDTVRQDLEATPELTSATTVTSVSSNGDNDYR